MQNPFERNYDLSKTAVAVKGEADGQAVLTAKGRGAVAEQILDLAFASGVRVREDKALAGMLAAFDLDSPIPAPALDAVAAVLARVYAERGQAWPDVPSESAATESE
ncbi:EscU/YscU/HrcU family type III secretion system export apparatus switch protein [Pedomonas mirosovicensis]|uniref:EscU/YscU/HrcU family type III secretion system export apparatus switch protein n=1 Tax=Pedomonas mirosovicensis TaxID=2908641 RepID=UPI002168F58A|nr:EscU/YscU/HrcU family type III secretion system export apparatus switch protein [Pedomonas mirosovicensis]MCH8685114.1 EscU/YscU/HrcU family type III secretion system export apparatus switch protein [Pedomonas mirosovicensis]